MSCNERPQRNKKSNQKLFIFTQSALDKKLEESNKKTSQITQQLCNIELQQQIKSKQKEQKKQEIKLDLITLKEKNNQLQISNQKKLKQQWMDQFKSQKKIRQAHQQQILKLKQQLYIQRQLTQRKQQYAKDSQSKVQKQRFEIEHLKNYLRETSTKYINLTASLKYKKVHEINAKDNQIQTMQKIIKFYQDVVAQDEIISEKDMQMERLKLIKLSGQQQGDLQALLNKLIKQEQYYRDRCEQMEKDRKLFQDENLFNGENCERIQDALKHWIRMHTDIQNRFKEANKEKEQLRKKVEELQELYYQAVESQRQALTMLIDLQVLMKSGSLEYTRDSNIGDNENFQRINVLNDTLSKELLRNQQLSNKIHLLQQKHINILSLQTKLTSAQQSRLQLQHKTFSLQQQLTSLRKKHRQATLQMNRHLQQLNIKDKDIKMLKNQIKDQREIEQLVKDDREIVEPIVVSEILLPNTVEKMSILKEVGLFQKRDVSQLGLIYRKDRYNHNFANYLEQTEDFPLLVILRINTNKIFGFYCSHYRHGGISSDSFIFSHSSTPTSIPTPHTNPTAIKCIYKLLTRFSSQQEKCLSYSDNRLVLGYNQVVFRNNSKDYQFKLNFNTFGMKYYDIKDRKYFDDILAEGTQNIVKYTHMEIHRVYF